MATFKEFGVSRSGPDNIESCLQQMSNWHRTQIFTLTEDLSFESSTYIGKVDGSGNCYDLYCLAVEDVNASGKKIKYLSWDQPDGDTAQYHNGANASMSNKQPPIRKLVYDEAEATVVKCYFQKFYR
jgi:hypothetical protein